MVKAASCTQLLLYLDYASRLAASYNRCVKYAGDDWSVSHVRCFVLSYLSRFLLLLYLIAAKVYPIGIPLLYAAILWKNRKSLNPRIQSRVGPRTDASGEDTESDDPERNGGKRSAKAAKASEGQAKQGLSAKELEELEERVKKRRENPDLLPSLFLWKDFGEMLLGVLRGRCALYLSVDSLKTAIGFVETLLIV